MIDKNLIHKIGLHPFVAFGVIVIDMMLFSSDVGVVTWIASTAVAAVMVFPCIVIQHFAYKDPWLIAIAKGFFIGIITAIPTPLPAILTGIGGIMGLLSNFRKKPTEITE